MYLYIEGVDKNSGAYESTHTYCEIIEKANLIKIHFFTIEVTSN